MSKVAMVIQIDGEMKARAFTAEGETEGRVVAIEQQVRPLEEVSQVRMELELKNRPRGVHSLPKPERVQVPEYRLWLATQPCCGCRGAANKGGASAVAVVGHHLTTGGMGTKGSDLAEIPLCPYCHQLVHASGITALAGENGMEWAWHQALIHLGRWLTESVLQVGGVGDGFYEVPRVVDPVRIQKMKAALETAVGAGDAAYHALVGP